MKKVRLVEPNCGPRQRVPTQCWTPLPGPQDAVVPVGLDPMQAAISFYVVAALGLERLLPRKSNPLVIGACVEYSVLGEALDEINRQPAQNCAAISHWRL